MKEKLESLGWTMYYECNTCQGHRQYFTNPEKVSFEIRTRSKNQTFSILKSNMVIAGPFWGYLLEEKLDQYVN